MDRNSLWAKEDKRFLGGHEGRMEKVGQLFLFCFSFVLFFAVGGIFFSFNFTLIATASFQHRLGTEPGSKGFFVTEQANGTSGLKK